MADTNQALADALTALTQDLADLQAAQAAAVVVPPPVLILDPFNAIEPFDLSSRAGSHAYTTAASPLDAEWDGTITKFPSFLIALRVRGLEVNWGGPAPQGILLYTVSGVDKNLFADHYVIPEATIEAERTARTDPRAIQNSRTLYKCLKSNIE